MEGAAGLDGGLRSSNMLQQYYFYNLTGKLRMIGERESERESSNSIEGSSFTTFLPSDSNISSNSLY